MELTVTGVESGRLTITLTNLTEKSQRVTIPAYRVDGLYVNELVSWKLAPQEVLETELPLPELALKWLGRENVMKVLLEAMETSVVTDVPWSAPVERAEAVELTLAMNPETAEAPNGTVLWDEAGESLKVLGVDYEDAACPQVMLQLTAKEPAEDEVQRTLFASVEVIAVNGETVADETDLFLPAGEMAVAALKLSGIAREELAVLQPVGKVDSLTLRYTIREGQVGAVIAEGESELDGETLTHWGNPDAWKDMTGKGE